MNTPLFTDYTAALASIAPAREAAMAETKRIILDAMKAAAIERITAEFDGEGDSGQIGTILAYPPAGKAMTSQPPVKMPDVEVTITEFDLAAQYEPSTESPSGKRFVGYRPERGTITSSLRDAIETITWTLLSDRHSGWENNDGGFGECVFDAEQDIIRLEMNERYTETSYHEHEW